MFDTLQVLTVLLVAVVALTLAHALELPGKMQLILLRDALDLAACDCFLIFLGSSENSYNC